MFKSRTLFVVGAGASAELDLPVGSALMPVIARKLDIRFPDGYRQEGGDPDVMEALRAKARAAGHDVNRYVEAGWKIRDGMPIAPSIDNFLDAHQEDGFVVSSGKIAIARAILDAERGSKIYFNYQQQRKPDITKVAGTWLPAFASRLVESVSSSVIEKLFENISFITFNYDRCIETFLFHAIQDYYGVPESRAAEILSSLRISHPYGMVGALPWQTTSRDAVPFGAKFGGESLLGVSEKIKTFTERVDEQTLLDQLKQQVSNAETIVFLGFSFQDQNMDLLGISAEGVTRRVFATAYGFSSSDCDVISVGIRRMLRREDLKVQIELRNNLKCADLFGEYSKSITQ